MPVAIGDDQLLEVATEAARLAAGQLMRSFGRTVAFKEKSSRNYVTELDAEAESLIIDSIRAAFPDHWILAEESGELPGKGEYRWIVDPLSSTRNYLHGMPHWAVCIAVERLGRPVVGLVLDPFSSELFTAVAGKGCYRNGVRARVSETPSLDRAMLCATFNVEGADGDRDISVGLAYYSRLARVADLRSLGSAGLHLGFVAAGRLDGFVSNSADFFATVAGALLVREAGGVVTDFQGREWVPAAEGLVASNGRFHGDLLRVVQGQ